MCMWLSLYMFLIHLLAWPWGSMISGHLRQLKMKMPLSVESASVGRPFYCQSLICTSFDKILASS